MPEVDELSGIGLDSESLTSEDESSSSTEVLVLELLSLRAG